MHFGPKLGNQENLFSKTVPENKYRVPSCVVFSLESSHSLLYTKTCPCYLIHALLNTSLGYNLRIQNLSQHYGRMHTVSLHYGRIHLGKMHNASLPYGAIHLRRMHKLHNNIKSLHYGRIHLGRIQNASLHYWRIHLVRMHNVM